MSPICTPFQFDLSFDPTALQASSESEGSFLANGGGTYFVCGTIDNTGGSVAGTADTLVSAVPGVSGAGTLATVNFSTAADGSSTLSLSNVILLDSNLNQNPVRHCIRLRFRRVVHRRLRLNPMLCS